jgi:type II secretory pathway pseudopilin PulG
VDTKQKGFSTNDLLIVIAIILIIAAIAIPNLHRSRIAAIETSVVRPMRTVNTAANTYGSTYGNGLPPKPCVYRHDRNRGSKLPQCLLA